MKKILIRWNKANVMSVGTGIVDGSVIMFVPGPNHINLDDWNKVKEHPTIKERMETDIVVPNRGKVKMLEVVKAENDEKAKDEPSNGISDLSVKGAKEIIGETFDTKLLHAWLDDESRKGVLTSIEKQLKSIEDERNNNDSNDSQE